MAADYKTLIGLVREFVESAPRTGDITASDLYRRAREALEPSKPKNNPEVLHFQLDDVCCKTPFAKAAAAGELDTAEDWTCPKCGTLWKSATVGGKIGKAWTPAPATAIFKL